MTQDWFGEARGTLASVKADDAGWEQLLELAQRGLEALGEERFMAEALPYLEQHAARWDDDQRLLDLDASLRAEHPNDLRWALARVFPIAPREVLRHARGGRVMVARTREAPRAATALEAVEVMLGHTAQTIGSLPDWARRLILTQPRYYNPPLPPMRLDAPLDVLELRGFSHAHDPIGPWLTNPAMQFGAPRFKELRLVGCDLDEAGMMALGPALRGIEVLSLERSRPGKSGLWMLAESGALAHIKRLSLRHLNALWDTGLEELTLCDKLGALEVLDLRECELTSRGARYLAQAPWRRGLRELDLRDNRIGPEGMAWLSEALPDGCRVRAQGCWGAQLHPGAEVLRVEADSVTPAMMREIVRVAQQHTLKALHILPRRMDRNALQILWEAKLPHVERISIKSLDITNHDIAALVEWPIARLITSLDLSGTRHIYLGNASFIHNLHQMIALEALDLSETWSAFASQPPRWVHTLALRRCGLREEHIDAIIHFARHARHLDVRDNDLDDHDLSRLRRALPDAEILG